MAQVHLAISDGKPKLHRVGISSLSSHGRDVNEFLRCDFLQFFTRHSSHPLSLVPLRDVAIVCDALMRTHRRVTESKDVTVSVRPSKMRKMRKVCPNRCSLDCFSGGCTTSGPAIGELVSVSSTSPKTFVRCVSSSPSTGGPATTWEPFLAGACTARSTQCIC